MPKLKSFDNSWKAREKRPINESSHLEKSRNAKASFVCGLDIHGDVIVASVGYPWRSHDLEHDGLALKSFYRSLTPTNFCSVLCFVFPLYSFWSSAEALRILPCFWLL